MQKYFILILFISIFSFANEQADSIKNFLQNDLKINYLPSLEKKFGNCGATPESCLSQVDDHMVINLPRKSFCFPYTLCGFYHCMEEKYQCEDVGNYYFTKLAYPTCTQYMKNVDKNMFSDKAVEWIFSVMVCLQKGLINECEVNGKCNQSDQKKRCDHITEFTLSYHPGCYINSGVGICHLPLSDKIKIWNTVNPFMTQRERQEAYKVIFHCIFPEN